MVKHEFISLKQMLIKSKNVNYPSLLSKITMVYTVPFAEETIAFVVTMLNDHC